MNNEKKMHKGGAFGIVIEGGTGHHNSMQSVK